MNILNIHLSYPPNVGGVDTILYHLSNELVTRNHKVFVITKLIPGTPFVENIKGVKVTRLEFFPHFETSTVPLLAKKLKKVIIHERIDVAAFWNLNTWCLARLRQEFPEHVKCCLIPIDFVSDALCRFLIGDPIWDGFVTFTEVAASETIKYGAPREKIARIPLGLNLDMFESPETGSGVSVNSNDRLVLCPARLDPVKGHKDLMNAIREVRKQITGVKLLLLAPNSVWWYINTQVKRELAQQIQSMNLQQTVTCEDTASVEDMPYYYSLSDVVVLPSHSESIGLVVLEAMASGKPVIGTNVGPVGEFIRNGDSGLVVNPGNWKGLANCLLELLTSDDKLKEYGENGRFYVKKNHDVKDTASHIENLYDNL